MKDFKGIYGEQEKEKEVNYYEHGAHFKYSDLVNALNKLQSKQLPKKDLKLQEELNNTNEIKIAGEKKKKKKYKLKLNTEGNNEDNNRYKDFDVDFKVDQDEYPNEEKKNDNEKFIYHLKKSKIVNTISKSVDRSKINLPKIVFNHINNNSNINNNNNPISLRNKSFNSKELKELFEDKKTNENKKNKNEENSKVDVLPKLDSNCYNQNLKEKEYKKTIENIKMLSIKNKNKRSYNNNNHSIDRMNTENGKSKFFLNNRIRSIFEIEKEIKKNYLNKELSNNNYNNNTNKNYMNVINNDISNQIYRLKKNLLNNINKKENSKI